MMENYVTLCREISQLHLFSVRSAYHFA